MRVKRFEWVGAAETARAIRAWAVAETPSVDVAPIEREVRDGGDEALLRLTARFDATERPPSVLRVEREALTGAFKGIDSPLRLAMQKAAANIRAVAEAQLGSDLPRTTLPQGQSVTVREVPVGAAGIYAPGGRAAYPSSVLMCAIPAQVAGVRRVALVTPPGPDGHLNPLMLAAAELCEIEEVYAVGGAQAIFALAYGTETIDPVDVIAGPGNAWVREAKRAAYGTVGIDSLAGPSELMIVTGPETKVDWIALDLCAQAEHGADGPLVVVTEENEVLDRIAAEVDLTALARPGVGNAALALVQAPGPAEAIGLANSFAPEHLELCYPEVAALANRVTTAGCVFTGPYGATVFGDYVAGSNHVLPTGGAGRFSGPLGPHVFRRKIATVDISEAAAQELSLYARELAEAEGFPVHAESAMIRREEGA
jgi:histidinol dehydrogenase